MNVEFLDYLEDIVDAMEKAEILIEDVSYEEFESDFRIPSATIQASAVRVSFSSDSAKSSILLARARRRS